MASVFRPRGEDADLGNERLYQDRESRSRPKRAHYLEEAQSAHARLVDYLTAVRQCSHGQATTVARLVESLHRIFTPYVNLTVTGDGEASVPSTVSGSRYGF
jgi:hypothetical protein